MDTETTGLPDVEPDGQAYIGAELRGLKGDPFVAAVCAMRTPMVIIDPRLDDNPIVFANAAFYGLTGYVAEEVLGRNCRFLQGPATNQDHIAMVREAISRHEPIEIKLQNYRKDGKPFWNHLQYPCVVESTLGKGTTFTLYLPQVEPVESSPEVENSHGLVDGQGLRVLVVEDNTSLGLFAVEMLTDLGYEPVLVSDAQAALNRLSDDADHFDVVFTDVVMPGMNGIELGQRIRSLYPGLPVVLTSGYSHVLAQNGTYGFELLHKPYSVEQASQVILKAVVLTRCPTGD